MTQIPSTDLVIDHIGIVVRSLDDAIPAWEKMFGYTPMTEPVLNTRQKVKVIFLQKKGSVTVKLIEPADASSPVAALSARGGGLHHLCFQAGDMQGALSELEKKGARVIVRPEPGEAFENEPIAFAFALGLPTEIIATEKRARRVAPEALERTDSQTPSR
jgi:methylmalonyl-CoA/ethylmalonyl-CoA epimerase